MKIRLESLLRPWRSGGYLFEFRDLQSGDRAGYRGAHPFVPRRIPWFRPFSLRS